MNINRVQSSSSAGSQALSSPADFFAIGLSSLCIVHCLALPLLAVSLPVLGVVAEAEWVHKLLVLTALPISAFAILRTRGHVLNFLFVLPIMAGFTLLLAGAFMERFHDYETLLTVCGALLVAGGHLWRWLSHR